METQRLDNIEYVSWFLFSPRGIERLEAVGKPKIIPADTVLVAVGEVPDFCYVIKSGRVIGCDCSRNGKEHIYCVNEPNSILFENEVLLNDAVPIEFRTTCKSELYCLTREDLEQLIRSDPEVAMDLVHSLSLKLGSVVRQMKYENEHSATEKVCHLLLSYAEKFGVENGDGIVISEKLSQKKIANLLGLNRITVVRIVKDLKTLGMLDKQNDYYCIYDSQRLAEYGEQAAGE